ncbi:MAG: Fe-S cluster assembly scaffold protein NifU [Candidatus Aminicenantes bacterium]|nr:Fe-S cluster assembly scaffold protein NifU [Candidatus Aminicenantes bacterium]
MKSTQYSEKVLDHFRNPRNVGALEGEDVYTGRVGNPVCGDLMEIYIKVEDNKIEDIKLKTFGCGSAIATASMVTEMARGKTLEEAEKITRQDVADELDGLPPIKMHCSNLAADALKDAIKNYRDKKGDSPHTAQETQISQKEIVGEKEFLAKGVYHETDDLSLFKDKRILIAESGTRSIETAFALIKLTPRVVFATTTKEVYMETGLKKKFRESGVKVLFESEIIEIKGFKEVEKVVIHDLDEDEEYELFVDAVIIEA